jgi:hypothetical protein
MKQFQGIDPFLDRGARRNDIVGPLPHIALPVEITSKVNRFGSLSLFIRLRTVFTRPQHLARCSAIPTALVAMF